MKKQYTSEISYEHHGDYCTIYVNNKFYCNCDHGELMQEIRTILEGKEKYEMEK